MRISDWSSDVCSSDLRSGSCRLALAGGQSRDLQEIGEHRVAVLGRDAFGMELDAVDRQLGVAETHHRAVVARRVDHEPLGNVDHLERSEEHTSELPSLMRNSYAVFCLNKQSHITTTCTVSSITQYTIVYDL